MPVFQVDTLTPEPFAYITVTAPMKGIAQAMGDGFAKLSELFGKAGATMAGMPMCHYLDYDETTTTFQLGFPAQADQLDALRAAGLRIGETPAGLTMRGVHIGPYDQVESTYNAMLEAMKAKGLNGTRDMWEIYFSPPGTPPEQIRTEVMWPVRAAA